MAKCMCLPKSRAQNEIWTQNPLEIYCVNLFNRLDAWRFILNVHQHSTLEIYVAADAHTDPPHAHAHAHTRRYSSADGKALSTGGGISEQNRNERQTRLPFSKLMPVFVYVCVRLVHTYWIYTQTVASIQLLVSRTEHDDVNRCQHQHLKSQFFFEPSRECGQWWKYLAVDLNNKLDWPDNANALYIRKDCWRDSGVF